ncbi:MAG: selenide, water dikinase SelD [Planctomycetes bacterium]|nr:selenide, water dikinase SelD [Planctomycetota bacterium]
MNPSATRPIEKSVLLVGAGNAHLVFLRRFGMSPIPGVAVTLVNEAPVIPYSAMVPGCIGGEYSWDEVTIDLVRLCQHVNVRFVAERVTGIDPKARQVLFADRPPLTYDVLSLGLGSIPACPAEVHGNSSLVMRPLAKLMQRLDTLDESLTRSPQAFHLVVVGGGASGCELSLAIHKRLGKHSSFRLTLLQSNPRILPDFPSGVAAAFENAFRERGITWRVNARVVGGENGSLRLEGGEHVSFDAVLWATQASPPSILHNSGLSLDANGFLRVSRSLQSISDPAIFGTGDCVSFESYPDLAKNGVHAVREGKVLFDALAAFLHQKPTRPFKPQRYCLSLLNTADNKAVLSYGPFTWKSRRARRLKDRIDRAWIRKFTDFVPMTPASGDTTETPLMRCGGCGSKISSDVLSAVLKHLDVPDDPRILLGTRAGEDAAVHRVRPDLFGNEPDKLLEVQTVDYFKAFIDDPYLFGRIAALNAVSDLYAMNARPFTALAIATLPYARGPIQESQLYELLSGAVASFKELGVVLTGGHTTEGPELALGFSVTGFAEEGRLFQKGNLRPGDVLILTKPLGSGALLAAWMRGECRAAWFEPLLATMLLSNREAGHIFAEAGVSACTDVTGFGLAGHLLEMLDASRVSARLTAEQMPLYDGFEKVVADGIVSTLHGDNAKVACRVEGPTPASLFDPQTSGGLLGAVRQEAADAVIARLHVAGFTKAAAIGTVQAPEQRGAPGIVVS